jgi:hypothetical protein
MPAIRQKVVAGAPLMVLLLSLFLLSQGHERAAFDDWPADLRHWHSSWVSY